MTNEALDTLLAHGATRTVVSLWTDAVDRRFRAGEIGEADYVAAFHLITEWEARNVSLDDDEPSWPVPELRRATVH